MKKKKSIKIGGRTKIKKIPISPSKFLIGKRLRVRLRRVD